MVRDDALVIVLAGGAGERLSPLTRDRAKPAVYFGGPYRIIDFVLSQLHQLGAAPHLHRHAVQVALAQPAHPAWAGASCRRSWASSSRSCRRRSASASTGIWAPPTPSTRTSTRSSARRRATSSSWPATTSTRWTTGRCCAPTRITGADVTLATIEVPLEDGQRFGIVAVDDDRPRRRLPGEAARSRRRCPGMPHLALASMGIYVFNMDVLVAGARADAADPDSQHDFGKNIIPALIGRGPGLRLPVLRREQEGGEVLARHRHARRLLRSQHGPVPRQPRVQPLRSGVAAAHLPAAGAAGEVRLRRRAAARATALDSVISPGCIVSGSRIRGSILCPNVRVHSFCDDRATRS